MNGGGGADTFDGGTGTDNCITDADDGPLATATKNCP